ncbi:MAG: hypothetical protein K5795_02520 [Lachnospiraceae bacterium]|nr:hypothetical protein [Lachnospiraceae bacterium]
MLPLIVGLVILVVGILLLIIMRKHNKMKVPAIIMIAVGAVAAVIGVLMILADSGENDDRGAKRINDKSDKDDQTEDENTIKYVTNYVTINIVPDEEEELNPDESPAKLHPEDTIEGVTEDGVKWSTDKKDGTGTIHMNVNGKNVSATVKPKADKKTDAGKAAEAAAKLVNTGYKKGVDNYNHDYAIWYVEPAQCLVYYPAQLKLSATFENGSAVFTDSRSKAKLNITLDENEFACMDDVESFIANTEYNKVLATGTDWYSCENVGKSMTEYSVTGLGQDFAVNATLIYENKYDFVFNELRRLIKCKFVEGGKWVSKEFREAAEANIRAASPIFQNPYADGMEWKLTSWYFNDWNCYLDYPDIFTKAAQGENNDEYFTDPKTGAYIRVYRDEFSGTLQELIELYYLPNYDIAGEDSVRGYYSTTDDEVWHYILLRDGYEYHAEMYVPQAYAVLYNQPAAAIAFVLPGDENSNIEMQDVYFPDYMCYITIPLQFSLTGQNGSEYSLHDNFNGMDMRVSFTDITAYTDTGNIFDMFEIVADDGDIKVGNSVVKWHSQDGLFIGAMGDYHAGMLEMSYPNAQTAYEKSWTRFNMRFDEKAKEKTIADMVEQDIKEEDIEAQPTGEEEPDYEPQPTGEIEPTYEPQPTGEPEPTYEPQPTDGPEPTDDPEPTDEPGEYSGDYEMENEAYREDFEIIANRVGRGTIYEEFAAALGIVMLGTPENELYGSVSIVDFGDIDTADFENNLKKMGLEFNGEDNSEGHATGYYGLIKGYEGWDEVHVTIWEYNEAVEITWVFTEKVMNTPDLPGGIYCSWIPFTVDDCGYGNIYTDVYGTSRFGHICRILLRSAKKYIRAMNGFGTGASVWEYRYMIGYATALDYFGYFYYDDEYHPYGMKDLDDFIEKYDIPGYMNESIDDSHTGYYNALIHYIGILGPGLGETTDELYYVPGAGVFNFRDGEPVYWD